MSEPRNPYESPSTAKLRTAQSEGPTTFLGKVLLGAWLTGLGCVFASLPLEAILSHWDLHLEFGWLNLISSMTVLAVPWFTQANVQTKAIYFLCSVGAICMTLIAAAFVTSLLGIVMA